MGTEYSRKCLEEARKLMTLNNRTIEWWDRSGRYNSVVDRRVELRHRHIMWLLDRAEVELHGKKN